MKVAIIGYGKMGKEIEKVALTRGHSISGKVNSQNLNTISDILAESDVAIEFSAPAFAIANMNHCFDTNVPVVVGTTGWKAEIEQQEERCRESEGALLYASNFSLGVNMFFEVNKTLATLMDNHNNYNIGLTETHHTEKLDTPSGTAITLADDILEKVERKSNWVNGDGATDEELTIHSHREEGIPGTHEVTYRSETDEITIKHTAFNRQGFALGAVLAAEFILGRTGVFLMKDVLQLNSEHVA